MRGLVLIAALLGVTGCDRLFGLDHFDNVGSGDDGGSNDARTPDAPDDGSMRTLDGNADAYVQKTCLDLGYANYGGSFYRVGGALRTWLAAELDCEDDATAANALHTHLAVLSDGTEANNVWVNALGSPNGTAGFWIGYSDSAHEGLFVWVTDQFVSYPAPTDWQQGEPNGAAAENCAFESSTLKLSDESCSQSHVYACECDAFKPNGSF